MKAQANTNNKLKEDQKDTSYNSDITSEDLKVLGQDIENNIRQDGGDDVALTNRVEKVDFSGKDLDVPGRSAASKKTTNRIKDEENMLYSQGGESKENLEEQSDQYIK
ncbi:hypothetical protein DCS32_13710 [Dokdonia sp. Dokd-P16]|uniref:hypothetical protein n=1 Tax=Dokdonia sp. Dokd-P16 TaxID=2173169 RepID=UPI000D5484AF|nr:hypothetical protein [Dokdonia sp. Dokd-P16]AWH75182.1 hypothetical protein DCS32_13710 [Dokdonia sp. Dokd-P16]